MTLQEKVDSKTESVPVILRVGPDGPVYDTYDPSARAYAGRTNHGWDNLWLHMIRNGPSIISLPHLEAKFLKYLVSRHNAGLWRGYLEVYRGAEERWQRHIINDGGYNSSWHIHRQ